MYVLYGSLFSSLENQANNRGEIETKFLDGVKAAGFKIHCLKRHLYIKFLAWINM